MSGNDPKFAQALIRHDELVARSGLAIWVGSEPTFTLASSEAPEWLCEPLGGEKKNLAMRLWGRFQEAHPGALALRTVGRQYAQEERPRWSFGLYARRDGQAVWQGPSDPGTGPPADVGPDRLDNLALALTRALSARGWQLRRPPETEDGRLRLLARADGVPIDPAILHDERLSRGSVHDEKTPHDGLRDGLADDGLLLILLELLPFGQKGECAAVELPGIEKVDGFLDLISALETASKEAGLSQLVIRGHPPPVDHRVSWTTITPDPAVIEVNQAPEAGVGAFYAAQAELYAAADGLGLAPWRAHYNGRVTDSGGGGQITLGGPGPLESPFFRRPGLLSRLVRYLNHHPVLSYRFATDYVGPASQSPRPDEAVRDRFLELGLALAQLERAGAIAPEFLWACLAPFLADSSGNPHRSELNIEKLWNPYLPDRGKLGLVEFRAFRMPHSAERAAALAALLRAITAMLQKVDPCPDLVDWGDSLHDRFSLPWYLDQDLRALFTDLDANGLGLGPELEGLLLNDPLEPLWQTEFRGVRLELRRAIEFWPLVGDVASQEGGGSRLVDSSTARLELRLRSLAPDAPKLGDWRLSVAGRSLAMRTEQDEQGELRLAGLRYREFNPRRGLHPGVRPLDPVGFTLSHPFLADALYGSLHGWKPDSEAYDGLPGDPQEAGQRLTERLVTRTAPAEQREDGPNADGALTLDLRWPP